MEDSNGEWIPSFWGEWVIGPILLLGLPILAMAVPAGLILLAIHFFS